MIVSPVERDGDRVDFTLKLSQIRSNAAGQTAAQVDGELVAVQIKLQAEAEIAVAANWARGDRVMLAGELVLPAEARNFGGFDYRAYLHTQRIHWLLKGSGAGSVEATPPESWELQPCCAGMMRRVLCLELKWTACSRTGIRDI